MVHGGFDDRAFAYIGTPGQGGSLSDCSEILSALGHPGRVMQATRPNGEGLGCHVWPDGTNYWLSDPNFDPTDASPSGTPVQIACGCLR